MDNTEQSPEPDLSDHSTWPAPPLGPAPIGSKIIKLSPDVEDTANTSPI